MKTLGIIFIIISFIPWRMIDPRKGPMDKPAWSLDPVKNGIATIIWFGLLIGGVVFMFL